MAGYLNRVHLIGDIDRTPEIRHTQSGKKVAMFSVATTEVWTDKLTQQSKEHIEWHRVVIFHPGFVNLVEQEVTCGTRVYIEGQLQTRKWKDNHAHIHAMTEVVLHPRGSEFLVLGTFPIKDKTPPFLIEPEQMTLPFHEI
jgi:single-strand DNA-binding protein